MKTMFKIQFPRTRFARDTDGSLSVEAVLIAPLLVWAIVATFVFYDGFRSKTRVQIAANSVVDVLSRETDLITSDDIDQLNNLFDALSGARTPTRIRVSSVAHDNEEEGHVLAWSYGTRGLADAENLEELTGIVPPVLLGEALIVVETFSTWTPPFSIPGISGLVKLDAQVASRPRFAPRLNFEGVGPVFASNNAEWGNPDAGYDPYAAGEMAPYAPIDGNSGTGNPDDGGGGTGGTGDGGTGTGGAGDGGTGGQEGGGSLVGGQSQTLQQVGLWTFDNSSNRNFDEAVIRNSAQPVGRIGLPEWRQHSNGLYQNDGGYHLDNCRNPGERRRENNDNRRQIVIPWHADYDLTSATVRMVFNLDGLPRNNSYGYNPTTRELWWNSADNSAWALFSRDAVNQNEPGHFSSFVTGDGAVFVRFQVWSNIEFYGEQYAGTNFFLYAPPGSVEPGVTYDMQITFDHDFSQMDLYLNGALMDRRDDVPITLAGNQEYWQLGGSGVYTDPAQHNTPDWDRTWMCGTIHHFEIWEGAYTAKEVQMMSCGMDPYSEEWFEYFYLNSGRYPLPSEGVAASPGSEGICNSDPDTDGTGGGGSGEGGGTTTPEEPPAQCTGDMLADMNFEDWATVGWSRNNTEQNNSFTRFLGRFGRNETVTWSRSLPSGTNALKVEFDLYIIDSWDGIGYGNSGALGDRMDFMVNNQLIGHKVFTHWVGQYSNATTITSDVGGATYTISLQPMEVGSNLGFAGFNDQRWRVVMDVTNPPSSFNLGFLARLDQDRSDESWGLDNFKVRVPCSDDPVAPVEPVAPVGPVPTLVVNVDVPYHWGGYYENWHLRPASIPSWEWDAQPFTISGENGIQAWDIASSWSTSGLMNWGGTMLRLSTTPPHGATATAFLTIGHHVVQYNFTRATNP
ncbi:Flp pilus assembly protein TadG [Roseinatronobacter thiooxidans]|uniref:Flp pilus assembly protein TadG n=2 Tax=Roseinatronobacter thiooxidans TaxID=121821 RepID=A0A2W7QHM5_9RHOB|nr:LamG-like jellyroll fold domain-containing protein [Roseinatronobacter thiooxidans]PZX40729.1 Flp pilus assembly protein TadG [Roseinatronobacter thiooxidans]